jgi:hypothetical protein
MDVVHYYETNRDLESFSCSPNGGKQKSRNNLIDDLAVDVTKKRSIYGNCGQKSHCTLQYCFGNGIKYNLI